MGLSTLRRVVDVVVAALILSACAPLLVVCAVLIAREDRGPIIYRRRLVGRRRREFTVFKLRSMRVDADVWLTERPALLAEYQRSMKLVDDPRVTGVGRLLRRFSLDELPQFANVLRGEMTLVGPRAVPRSELERFGAFGAERSSLKPGVTGLWQVHRSELDYARRIELDRIYVEHRSVWLDLYILARTLPAVLFGRGAC